MPGMKWQSLVLLRKEIKLIPLEDSVIRQCKGTIIATEYCNS